MALDAFRPHRPDDWPRHSEKRLNDQTPIEQAISQWRQKPGENIALTHLGTADSFETGIIHPTLVGHLAGSELPRAPIEDLKVLRVVSVNLNALGDVRDDKIYREQGDLNSKEKKQLERIQKKEEGLLAFLRDKGKDAAIVCLQDVPLYRLKTLGPKLNAMGFSYYANIDGINGPNRQDARESKRHINGLVTLVNTWALKNYTIDMPTFSLTPHAQGTHRDVHIVSNDGQGKQGAAISHGEQDWEAMLGPGLRTVEHWATQTFNCTFKIHGTNGARTVSIGNTYMAPSSFMIDRSRNVRSALQNQKQLSNNDIAIMVGDMNSYGYDSAGRGHFGPFRKSYPFIAGISALFRQDRNEVAHLQKIAERQGFLRLDLGTEPTITKGIGPVKVGMQLDHAFVSGAKRIEGESVGVPFSDHRALVSRILL